jgi:mRNA-degrading endonuclease toxin of MazEF toxin-antitoxin module
VAKALLGKRIGRLTSSRESEVKRALGYALDWPELKVL